MTNIKTCYAPGTGGALAPVGGTIIVTGNAVQGVSVGGAGHTLTATVADWTTAQKGVGVLSTNAQAVTGTGITQAVTPAALTARLEAPGPIGGTTPALGTFSSIATTTATISTLVGNLSMTRAAVGANVGYGASNTDNTNAASSCLSINECGGGAAGDSGFGAWIAGGQQFTWGIDNSTAADDFVISNDGALGANNRIVIDGATGVVDCPDGLDVSAGEINANLDITSLTGDLVATDGNLVLVTAGNKIQIAKGANASNGLSAAMVAGAVTVATTACSGTANVFYSRATLGGAVGHVSITAQDGTGFTLTSSSATETSTFNWWIINL